MFPHKTGHVSWKQTEDRLAVTWQSCPYTFQIEMFFDGKIGISWLDVPSAWGVAGLSEGLGVPPDFQESDLRGYPIGPCPCYALSTTAEPSEGGVVLLEPPGGRYPDETVVRVSAEHAPHWHFDHWEGDANATVPRFEMIMDANMAIQAVFAPGDPCYTLTTEVQPAAGGAIEPQAGQHLYPEGEEIEVKATAVPGWEFDHWEGDANGTEPNVLMTMDWHKTATAVFVRLRTLTIDVQPDGSGTVDPPEGEHVYPDGTLLTLRAFPTPPLKFDHWEGAVTGTDSNTELLIDADKSVTAWFSMPSYYELDIQWGSYGHVQATPEPNDANIPWKYSPGTVVTLTAVEDQPGSWTCWHMYDPNYPWDVNYAESDFNMVLTLVMNGDRQVGAEFTCGGAALELLPIVVVTAGILGVGLSIRRRY